jgi:hypothetical protein
MTPGAVQANYTFYEPFETLQDIQEGVYYRIHAYKDGEQENLDNMSINQLFVSQRPHFRVSGGQTTYTLSNELQDITIAAGTPATVYGTTAANHITIESGAYAELINFPGSNLIAFQSEAALFEVSRSGTVVTFQGSDGTILKIPATSQEQNILFSNDGISRLLRIEDNQVKLDDQVITATPASI